MSGLGAFLAGMGTGYYDSQDKQKTRERQDRIDKISREKADREQADWQEQQDTRAQMKQAGAQVQVQDNTTAPQVPMDDNGNQMPNAGTYGVQGQQFNTQAQAQGAADTANLPDARLARQVGVLNKQGRPGDAAAMQTAGYQLDEAQQKHLDNMYGRRIEQSIQASNGSVPDGVAKLMTDSQIPGLEGMTGKVVRDAANKTWQVVSTAKDGTQKPGKVYQDDEQGYQQARIDLARAPNEVKIKMAHEFSKDKSTLDKNASEVKKNEAYADYLDRDKPRSGSTGAGSRSDHFDEKQWDGASKPDKSVISLPDASGEKDVESGDLMAAHRAEFTRLRNSGEMTPSEAQARAAETIVRLKEKAQERVGAAKSADKKSGITVQQAVRDILKEARAARPKPQSDGQIAPQVQQARDTDAGVMVIQNEYGGDLAKAQATANNLAAAMKTAKTPEQKMVLQQHLNILQMGLAKLGAPVQTAQAAPAIAQPSQQQAPAAPAPQAAPAPAVAAAPAGSMDDLGPKLDAVRAQQEQAAANLRSYGLAKQKKDPSGFVAAQQQVAALNNARMEMEQEYTKIAGASMNRQMPVAQP